MKYGKIIFRKQPNELHMKVLYSETDDNYIEIRKVCVFVDGKMGFAGHGRRVGCFLAEKPLIPFNQEIAGGYYSQNEISENEFNIMWEKAQNSPYPELSLWKFRE